MNTMAAASPAIEARQLIKRFGATAVVDRLDLTIPRGGCYGLLGPNGAGKTTTLRMILGHSPPSGGRLTVLGEPMPAAGRRVRARIGVVAQTDNLDPDFTVMENLRVYAGYFPREVRPTGARLRARLESLLEFVALSERADAKVAELSGGMCRRLVIARALVNDPELLILDEPTTGLDPQVRQLIHARLRELKERGTTILLTTHYMEEAERLCDLITIIDGGRSIAEGTPRSLVAGEAEASVVEVRPAEAGAGRTAAGDSGAPASLAALPIDEFARVARVEEADGGWRCHTNDPAAILALVERFPGLECLQRPTNLEDVFLRLTGHALRD